MSSDGNPPGRGGGYRLTPWSAGAPPLNAVKVRNHRRLGWVPTRRQVLAGYTDPYNGVHVEGQVPRAVRELEEDGVEPTVEQVADRLAICPGDRDFLAVLLGVDRVEDGDELPLLDALRFAREWADFIRANRESPPVDETEDGWEDNQLFPFDNLE